MAPSQSALGRRNAHPQPIYSTAAGEIVYQASKAGAYTFIRVSALTWADLLAAFALYVIINYLTSVWNLSITHAAGIINIWNGIVPALCIVFAFFADSFMGSYYLLVLSSIAYSIGLGLLFLSTPNFFGPCKEFKEECIGHKQEVLFFTALTLIAVGQAGHLVSVTPFIDAQLKREDGAEDGAWEDGAEAGARGENIYLQILGLVMVWVVIMSAAILLPYIKPWPIRFGIPAICTLTATGLFLSGSPSYKHNKPEGSPIATALRVFVAAASKDFQQVQNFKKIYNDDDTPSTSSLRCLDKAAIKFPDQARSKSWTLCTVREVEETKIGIRMVPMCLTFIVIGLVLSIGNTYFLEQANHMDRKLGSIKIQIPILLLFYTFFNNIFIYIWSLLTMCFPRHYVPPIGIAVAMILSALCCITAAIVETRRLDAIRDHGLRSVFYLLPQFALLGGADEMINTSFRSYVKYQLVPESMHRYLLYFQKCVLGLGNMASVLLVYVVGKVNPNWFQHTLNKSRLDLYYWTLAGISAVNLVIYVIVACFYTYKSPEAEAEGDGDEAEDDGDGDVDGDETKASAGDGRNA